MVGGWRFRFICEGEMKYQICTRCVMDTSDPDIIFDENGVCNHCKTAQHAVMEAKEKREKFNLSQYLAEVKQDGKGRRYDCIIGISGGVDSGYTLHLAKQYGLRPLAVHYDNGWDMAVSVCNIRIMLEKMDVDLYTYVVDWEEFRELQMAFFRASVPDMEIPTDHMIYPVLGHAAHKYGVKHIWLGMNTESESILPRAWSQGHNDWKYIKDVFKKYGKGKLTTFPYFTRADYDYFWRNYDYFSILNYMDYNKDAAKELLITKYGWKDYGGKHCESFYTKFYQSYILPEKFGYDKRRAHLSSLIVSGRITREDALKELKHSSYDQEAISFDIEYFCEKMNISLSEYNRIMSLPPRNYHDYKNQENDLLMKLYYWVTKKKRA